SRFCWQTTWSFSAACVARAAHLMKPESLPALGCACASVRRAARAVTRLYDEALRRGAPNHAVHAAPSSRAYRNEPPRGPGEAAPPRIHPEPPLDPRQHQSLARPRHPDIQQPPGFLDLALALLRRLAITGDLVILHAHDVYARELQALGGVQREEVDAIGR